MEFNKNRIDATKQCPKTGFNTYEVNKHLEYVYEAIVVQKSKRQWII